MTTLNLMPPTVRLDLIIEMKDLSQTVTELMQAGIHFTINYSPSHVEREDTGDIDFDSLPLPKEAIDQSIPDKKRFFLETMDRIIEENLLAGTTPTLEEMAIAVKMKRSRVNAQLMERYGKTFHQYCLEKKMKYAAELLEAGYKAVEVSVKIGYKYPIKFNKMFQKHFGITPKRYQIDKMKIIL